MKKTLLLILMVFLNTKLLGEELTSIVQKVMPSVFLIETLDEDNKPLKFGTGFFIGDSVVTNLHVVWGGSKIFVKKNKNEVYAVTKIAYKDESLDIVKLFLEKNPTSISLELSEDLPQLGEKIFVIGNPMGLESTLSDGIVSSLRDYNGFSIIQVSSPVSQGSSGSPLFNASGKVLGIISAQLLKGQNLNFALAKKHIVEIIANSAIPVEEFLNIAKENYYLVKYKVLLDYSENYDLKLDNFIEISEKELERNPKLPILLCLVGHAKNIRIIRKDENNQIRCKNREEHLNAITRASNVFLDNVEKAILIRPDDLNIYKSFHLSLFPYVNLGSSRDVCLRVEKIAKKCQETFPNSAEGQYVAGRIYRQIENDMAGLSAFKKAIEINPNHFRSLPFICSSFVENKEFQKGFHTIEKIIDLIGKQRESGFANPDDEEFAKNFSAGLDERLIDCLIHIKPEEAKDKCIQLIKKSPQYPRGHFKLAEVYKELNDKPNALNAIEGYLQIMLFGKSEMNLLNEDDFNKVVGFFIDLNTNEKALEFLKKAESKLWKDKRDNLDALCIIAQNYFRINEPELGNKLSAKIEKELSSVEEDPDLFFSWALVLLKRGDKSGAIKQYEILKNMPDGYLKSEKLFKILYP